MLLKRQYLKRIDALASSGERVVALRQLRLRYRRVALSVSICTSVPIKQAN
jgi:hypothetical protein